MWFLVSNSMSRLIFLQIQFICIVSSAIWVCTIAYNGKDVWSCDIKIKPRAKASPLVMHRYATENTVPQI